MDIKAFVLAERASKTDALLPFLITSLKIDKNTKMELDGDIKNELRKVHALKINYAIKMGAANDNFR